MALQLAKSTSPDVSNAIQHGIKKAVYSCDSGKALGAPLVHWTILCSTGVSERRSSWQPLILSSNGWKQNASFNLHPVPPHQNLWVHGVGRPVLDGHDYAKRVQSRGLIWRWQAVQPMRDMLLQRRMVPRRDWLEMASYHLIASRDRISSQDIPDHKT
jgi:hypothetical protein